MTREARVHLPPVGLLASITPESIDERARTVVLDAYTGSRFLRYDWLREETYWEELVVTPEAVDLSRLQNGAPLLNAHNDYRLEGILGVVEEAWLENGRLRTRTRFSERKEVEPIWGDVRAKIIRNVSIGFNRLKTEEQAQRAEDGKRLFRTTRWQPFEVSLVPVGADQNAQVLSAGRNTAACLVLSESDHPFLRREELTMTQQQQPAGVPGPTTPAPAPAPAPEPAAPAPNAAPTATLAPAPTGQLSAEQAQAAEMTRQSEIRKAVRLAHLPEPFADELCNDAKVTIDQARSKILGQLAAASDGISSRIAIVRDERDTLREGAVEALLHRHNPGKHTLSEKGRPFAYLSLVEMNRRLLEKRGVKTEGFSGDHVARLGMEGNSDFPAIVADVANKTLRMGYDLAPRTFAAFCKRATAADFKNINRIQLGEAPKLEKVGPSGEIKTGKVLDSKETYALATYAKIVAINRQTIVNDDLNAFTRLPQLFGGAAAQLECDTVYSILTANAAMADGVALFHATHGNLLSGGSSALQLTSLSDARTAMRKQTGIDRLTLLNLQIAYLIVPAALETTAQQLTTQQMVPNEVGKVNPFASAFKGVIAEPRLDAVSATAWYATADPNMIDTIEYCYLEGEEGVRLETRMGWNIEGMELKAVLDFAAKAIDYRGMLKSAGA